MKMSSQREGRLLPDAQRVNPKVIPSPRKVRRPRCRTIAFNLIHPDGTVWKKLKLDAGIVLRAQAYAARFGLTFEDVVIKALTQAASDWEACRAADARLHGREAA
jgi:hypothetical protein